MSSSTPDETRGKWGTKTEYMLTCISFAVGLGNIWRFPYLCYKNGGGSFFIPYLLSLIFLGFTYFFLESSLGQFTSEGPMTVWKISPLFQGIGIAMFIMGSCIGIYYNMIIAWAIYFLYSSFTTRLPWSHCENKWNTPHCFVRKNDSFGLPQNNTKFLKSASDEFFHFHVLNISDGIDNIGSLNLHLVISLFIAWVLVFLCLIGGVKTMGKVSYITALLPYIVLTILLIRGATLKGAQKGIKFYLTPKWEKLLTMSVWSDAAMQIFFSLSICWGGVITLASYNKFNNNCLTDTLIIVVTNSATSIYGGFAIFSIIGFMAEDLGEDVEDVIEQGVGLGFVAYPAAIALLPIAPFWSVIFFLMLIALGLGTQITIMETIVVAILDRWPQTLKSYKIVVRLTICIVFFLAGLFMCTNAGVYILQLMDSYCPLSALYIALLEVLVIGWIYGIDRFLDNIREMLGRYPFPKYYWKYMWQYVSPIIILVILVLTIIYTKPLRYGDYEFPVYSEMIGLMFTLVTVLVIPIFAIYKLYATKLPIVEAIEVSSQPSETLKNQNEMNTLNK